MAAAQVLALQPRVPELRESSPKQGLADSPLVLRTFFFPHVSPFEDNRFERCIQSELAVGTLTRAVVPVAGVPATTELDPLQCALLPYPHVAEYKNSEEDQHFQKAERSKPLELGRPWK